MPMEGATGLVWLGGQLFVGRGDGLLAMNLESGSVQVLVSSRRTPPANEIDPLWSGITRIFALADGRLGALAHDNFLVFDASAGRWKHPSAAFARKESDFQPGGELFFDCRRAAVAWRTRCEALPRRFLE